MTTFWARILIFKAWEKGEITEKCAHYFDELLNSNKMGVDYEVDFNSNGWCVLRNIGFNSKNEEFDLFQYFDKTSYECGYPIGHGTVYLANLINTDYWLDTQILKILEGKPSKHKVLKIEKYLTETDYKCIPLYDRDTVKTKLQEKLNIVYETSYKKPAYTDLLDADY